MRHLNRFLLLWVSTGLALWIVDGLFDSLRFESVESLVMASLVLALVNLTIKPLLVVLTLPLTILSFGLALPLINGLVLLGVASLVPGFDISGFGWGCSQRWPSRWSAS
jgi:putative membrane protein